MMKHFAVNFVCVKIVNKENKQEHKEQMLGQLTMKMKNFYFIFGPRCNLKNGLCKRDQAQQTGISSILFKKLPSQNMPLINKYKRSN